MAFVYFLHLCVELSDGVFYLYEVLFALVLGHLELLLVELSLVLEMRQLGQLHLLLFDQLGIIVFERLNLLLLCFEI